MRLWIRSFTIAALVVIASPPSGVHAQSAMAEHPVELRARAFARAVSSGDPEEFKRLVREDFDPKMQQIPLPAHIAILASFWDMSHGLDFSRLQILAPDTAVAFFGNRLTGGSSWILFRVESESPYRVVAVRALSELHGMSPGIGEAPKGPVRKRSDRQIAREMDSFMKRLSKADVFSGVVELAKNGVPVFQAAYGRANKESGIANRIDTRFNLASMHKMFTAVAIAQLVERGQLSYEDPLAKFLPDFPDAESAKKIKIKNLLSHTSGLSMWWTPRSPQPTKSPTTIDEIIATISPDEKLQFEPGTYYQYSNTGFLVLGKVIEKVTGMTYYEYVRDNIYKPGGMENTDAQVSGITQDRALR
jgi:CubicO group peptidase (beta-lactamase class C family)